MLICVEGADAAGKSTLVKTLSKELGLPIVKFSKPISSAYQEYKEFLLNRKEPAILDRAYLGECVYGPLWRGKSDLSGLRFRNIEDLLAIRRPLMLYCETSKQEIAKQLVRRGDPFTKAHEIPAIVDGFHAAIKKSRFDWRRFDYRDDLDYRSIVAKAALWKSKMENELPLVQQLVDARVRGSLDAKTLYIGDVCNLRYSPKETSMPFEDGPGAKALMDLLPKDGSWAIVNATKAHAPDHDWTFYELSLPHLKRVIFLGNEAEKTFMGNVEKIVTPLRKSLFGHLKSSKALHPSYVKRFSVPLEKYRKSL